MEEEDKKTELNLEIWKRHQEKEAKGLKKIFIFIFLVVVLTYIVKVAQLQLFNPAKLFEQT